MGNLGWRGLALAQCLLESLNRNRQTDLASVPEAIRDGLGDAEHLDGTLSIMWVSTLSASSLSVKRATRIGMPSDLGAQSFFPMASQTFFGS